MENKFSYEAKMKYCIYYLLILKSLFFIKKNFKAFEMAYNSSSHSWVTTPLGFKDSFTGDA